MELCCAESRKSRVDTLMFKRTNGKEFAIGYEDYFKLKGIIEDV